MFGAIIKKNKKEIKIIGIILAVLAALLLAYLLINMATGDLDKKYNEKDVLPRIENGANQPPIAPNPAETRR